MNYYITFIRKSKYIINFNFKLKEISYLKFYIRIIDII